VSAGTDRSRALRGGRRIAGLLISVVAVGGCVWWASKQSAPRFPSGIGKFGWLVLALGVYALNTLARGFRWDAILKRAGVGHRRGDAYALIPVGYMGNTVLPARGGEVLRIFILSERSRARKLEVLGAIVPERLLDAATLVVLLCALSAAGVAGAPVGVGWVIAAAAAVVGAAIAFHVYLRLRRAGRFERFAARVRPVASASRILMSPAGLALGVLTIAVWLAEGLVLLLVARSVDVHLSLFSGTLCIAVASLSALVPALPGYVGTFDAGLLLVLHALAVRGGAATGLLLLYRFVLFVPITAVGLIILVGRYGAGDLLRAGGRRSLPSPDDQELLTENPPGERRAEIGSGQGAGGGQVTGERIR
jgi:uncharacterized membrane protein YbhN (UPF0104 family)